jgi:hypothetical protein
MKHRLLFVSSVFLFFTTTLVGCGEVAQTEVEDVSNDPSTATLVVGSAELKDLVTTYLRQGEGTSLGDDWFTFADKDSPITWNEPNHSTYDDGFKRTGSVVILHRGVPAFDVSDEHAKPVGWDITVEGNRTMVGVVKLYPKNAGQDWNWTPIEALRESGLSIIDSLMCDESAANRARMYEVRHNNQSTFLIEHLTAGSAETYSLDIYLFAPAREEIWECKLND